MAQDTTKTSATTETWGENDKPAPATASASWGAGDKEYRPDPPSRGFKGWARDVGAGAVDMAIAVPEAIVGLADIPTGGRVGKFLENEDGMVGFRPKAARETTSKWYSEATQEAERKFQEADGVVDKTMAAIQNPSVIAKSVGTSLGPMGLGGVAARGLMAATRLGQMGAKGAVMAGAAGEGATMAGSAAEQIRQETGDGLLTPTQAGLAAATGVVGGAFGFAGGRMAQRLGIGDADTMLAQGTQGMAKQFADDAAAASARAASNPLVADAAVKSIPRKVIEGAIAEGFLEELPQSMAEQIFQNIALDKPWHQELDSAAVMGVLSGGAMGAGAAGYRGFREPNAKPGSEPAPGAAPGTPVAPGAEGSPQPNAGLARVSNEFAARLQALQEQEQGEVQVPQTAPPDGAAILAQQQAQAQAARDAEIAASRAAESPDDEILQSIGATVQRPSEAMGLRSGPEAGSLENAAALSVDTGATAQLQQAAAQAQAAEAAKKGKPANQKQEQPAQAQQEVDQDTGEISGMPTMSDWSDADLSTAFRNAQPKDVRLQLANELSRRRAAREEAALQAQAPAPGSQAKGVNVATLAQLNSKKLAEMSTDELQQLSSLLPADHSRQQKIQKAIQARALQAQPAINEGAKTDGTQTPQAQQASAQPAQAGATQGGAQPAAGSAPGANTSGEGAGDGALRRTVGERGDVGAGQQWTRMSSAERQAVAARTDVKPVLRKNLHGSRWANLNIDVQRKLAAAISDANASSAHTDAPAVDVQAAMRGAVSVDHLSASDLDAVANIFGVGGSNKTKSTEKPEKSAPRQQQKLPPTDVRIGDKVVVDGDMYTVTGPLKEGKKAVGVVASRDSDANPLNGVRQVFLRGDDAIAAKLSAETAAKIEAENANAESVSVGNSSQTERKQAQTAIKTEAASAQPVSNSIENKTESTGQQAQVATERVASQPEQVTPAATGEKLKTNIFGLPDGIDFQPGTQAARAASLKAGDWIVADGNVTRVVDAQPQANGSVRLDLQDANGTSSSDFGPSDTVQRKLTNDGDNATAAPASVLDGILEGLDAIKTGMAKTGPVADAKLVPAKRKLPPKLAAKAAEVEAQRAAYFAPGNIVVTYAGYDRVISYTPADAQGNWSVAVQPVERQGDKWVDAQNSKPRTHSTQPNARALKNGPVVVAKAEAAPAVTAGDKRAARRWEYPSKDQWVTAAEYELQKAAVDFLNGEANKQALIEAAAQALRDGVTLGSVHAFYTRTQQFTTGDGLAAVRAASPAMAKALSIVQDDSIFKYQAIKQIAELGLSDSQLNAVTQDSSMFGKDFSAADYAEMLAGMPAPATKESVRSAANQFAGNKIFTADAVAAARERMKKKLGTLNSGLDPELMMDGMTIAGAYIESGMRSFGKYAKAMVDDMGEGVKPYLLSFWEAARHFPGVDTNGMTSAEDSAREHAALLTPEAKETAAEAVGEIAPKPAKRTRKTGSTGDMTLTQDWGVEHINGYSEGSGMREAGNATKDAFLKEAASYLKAVSAQLSEAGFEPHTSRNGKADKPVSVSESGMAGSGDVSLIMQHPDTGTNVYVTIGGTTMAGMVPSTASGIAIMYRTATGNDRYAAKGGNTWAPVDLSATDLALLVSSHARATMNTSARTADTPKGQDNANSEQSGRAADQGRAPEVSGRGGRNNDSAAPADSGDLESRQPGDVPTPTDSGRSGIDGLRVPAADVGRAGPADQGGNAGNGRARASGAPAPDAGAGKKRSVKAPEEVSPANPGPGNFHLDNPLEIVGGTPVARFDKNMAAIELLNTLRESERQATAEEQRMLAGYTGWGSFGQELFQGTWAKPMPKQGWEKRDQWLRDHLGQDEWESAQRSITNAHYTDPPTVMAMWDMVKRMGFGGGRVLEPSMGIGNFFGMMPADIKGRSQLVGIELDSLTGAMATRLYPDANIKVMGYQESKTPDNFYDVVIGNWPFENTVIADRRYNTLSPFLHDYFFLKALDQVRPGGLVVGITSNGTMDKKATRIRAALARKAELVTSIRLPSGAFQEYAGTKVVTDIVILKKRDKALSLTPNEPWINSVAVKTPAGPEVFINEFYAQNPGNVIGTTDFGHGTTRMQPGMIVHRPENMAERLREAVNMVPEGVFSKEDRTEHISYVTNHTADREGSLSEQKGQLYVVRGEHLAPAQEVRKYALKSEAATAKREQELRALIDMRRKYAALIEAERDGNAEGARKALREAYEAFGKAHGDMGDTFGLDYLRKIDDPFYPALAALTANGKPSDILTKSTMRGARGIENPTAQDAYVLARNKSVEPSLSEIAAIAGKPEAEVRAELVKSGAVFEAPNGDVVPSDIYLSGNVRQKLREAQAALDDGNKAMERNVAELKKVIPEDVPYFNIESQLGATWVPAKAYAEYVAHMLNRPSAAGIEATFLNGRWKIRLPDGANHATEARTGFGTGQYPFSKLVNAAFTNQTVKIRRKDSEGNEYVDTEATDEANARIGDIRTKFGEWLWSDPERRAALESEYNESRNSYATPKFDGSFLHMDGMALSLGRGPFNLRQHQVNAIWRALVNRRSLNAHEVGTGKTFTMGGIAVESRRYGIAKKPVLLAHNANSASVAAEIQQMYPAAKVLYIDNLDKDSIAVRMRQIANDDWDTIVMPHSLIDRLSFREETLMEMAREDIRALEEEAYAAAEEDGVNLTAEIMNDEEELKKVRSITAKELVKARNRIIETIKKQAMQSSREGAMPFEDLGIDMVLVDEAHEFKKPPISTRMNMKGLNTQTSNRSIALQFITRYIRANNFGGNVHTFTGTPITNTLTEIFHQMRYVMEDEMKAAGVESWDGWFGSFAKEVQDVELSAAGEYEAINRLAGFINVPELRRMIGQYMDVVFADDMPEMQPRKVNGKTLTSADLSEAERAELLNGRTESAADRPYKKVVNVTSDLTDEQSRIFSQLQAYARSWRSMRGKERMKAMRNGSPESPIITEGLANKASFDVRLMQDEAYAGQEGNVLDSPGSKASKVVGNVLEIYKSDDRAAQVVFAEQGFSTSKDKSMGRDPSGKKITRRAKTFSTMRDIVERLVQGGIPREQIAIVDGSTSKEKRKEIADAMNTLDIRVVIGSTDTLGVGVNMQRNLRAMHHMDAPYMPGELEQRNGRGLRQGNQWNTVLEYRYMTDRLDGRRWQILAIKQRFITAFMKANSDSRVIEGDAASDEESDIVQSFSEAAGDPRILIRAKLRKNVEALQRAERMHGNGVADARRNMRTAKEAIEWNRGKLREMTANKLPARLRAMMLAQSDAFTATVQGKTFDVRKDAEDAIDQFLKTEMRMEQSGVKVATYRDQTITARWPSLSNRPELVMEVDGQEFSSGGLRGLEQQIRNFPGRIEKVEAVIAEREASIERLEQVSKAPFARAADLDATQKRLEALEKDIDVNPVPPPAWLRAGAPVDSEAFRVAGQPFVVTGHRWTKDGWFVLGQDAKGEMAIPYNEVMDAQGMPLYEEREFQAPEVIEKEGKAAAPDSETAAPIDATANFEGGAKRRPGTAQDKAVMQAIADGKTTRDVLRLIASQSKDPFRRQVARLLLRAGVTPDIQFGHIGKLNGNPIHGQYRGKTDTIAMAGSAEYAAEHIFMHEAMHAATMRALAKPGLPKLQLQKLLEHVRKQKGAAGFYGTKNVDEFVAEIFTNADFQNALRQMSAPAGGTIKSAWDSFVRILRSILGLPNDSTNALSQALELGVAAMRQDMGLRQQGVRADRAANFGADDFTKLKTSALDQIHQTLSHPGKVSLWDKTVGTMRNLSERNPLFKPVFEAAQRFIDDVSMLANDAADAAPRLMPRVETLGDLKKKPITAADNKAVAKPLFEGTLMWARDLDGTPVTTDALNDKYRNVPTAEKAQILLRTGKIQERTLKMWMGLPVEQFDAIINGKFDSTILKSGVVWSQKELKTLFGLSEHQASLYQEARAAIDRSIDITARTDMLRLMGGQFAALRDVVLEQPALQDAFELVVSTLQEEARANPDMADRLMAINNSVVTRYETAAELMNKGYAPLSRFGKYTVDVVDQAGERQYFGMFESMREANQMAMKMRDVFTGAAVTQGTMSEQAFKLFQGITPESLEQFGSMLGLKGEGNEAQDKAFQAYLQLAKNNHSALKRLIHRKGIDGYSEDVGRVLASFVYSNARLGSGGLNAGTMEAAVEGIPKEQGELRDVAMGLRSYIQDPQEEGQAVRGMLFAQYLGGSVASAFVNMTQPFQITMPWLSQYGGMAQAGKQMARALKDMGTKGFKYEADLAKALQSAEDDGVVSPQEIHQLMAQARGTGSLRTGDGTKLGDTRAAAANNWERVKVAWGQPFALAEQFNRRSTFIASYRIAKAQGIADPAEFARKAVLETQFLYSKANKMKWARGTVGGTLMTFKTYSVSYLELMHRMWNQGEPGSPERAAGRRAVGWAVAMLLLMGGAGGLPFMEDAEDLIDGAGQLMGYNLSTKQWRKELIADVVGKELAEFVEQGVSGLPGAPVDVSGRLGMGNLIPGTGLAMEKQNRMRDLLEIAGPAGDLVARGFTGARKALTGDVAGAALEVSPTAVRNAAKGIDMATSGIYKDTKGYKVMDVSLDEAVAKFAGFQPKSVAKDSEASSYKQRTKSFYIQTSSEIKAQWAAAVFNKDDAALERVRDRLADWNRNNPDLPITVKIPDIMKKVREMGKDREQRINDTAPKVLRQQFREIAQEASR